MQKNMVQKFFLPLAGRRRLRGFLAFLLGLLIARVATAQAQKPDLVLHGTITKADRETYVEVPFNVPAGTVRVSVEFAYTDHDKQTTIDLGLFDNERFRGWSGGNKSFFTVSATDATPSYLPGPVHAGTWRLILGVPSIRDDVRSRYTAEVFFERGASPAPVSTFSREPIRPGPAWFRGDLHMHDAHSDGSCLSQTGKKVPCPLYKTVEAAAARHLDFIAITDHNTLSHFDAMRELQPYFDKLLLIPGREITTFEGHANVYGTLGFIDFRLTSKYVPTFSRLLDQVEQQHALLSINHPGLPTGSACMGCGWSVKDTDFSRIHVIEAVNGDQAEGPYSGVPFWQKQLNQGHRITAVGGSDNHNATLAQHERSAIGYPTTVLYATDLSEHAILEAIRAGHAFIDTEGTPDRAIEFTARLNNTTTMMGDDLTAPAGSHVRFTLLLSHLSGAHAEVIRDGELTAQLDKTPAAGDRDTRSFDEISDGGRHWLRVNIRAADGTLLILGNPISLNFPASPRNP